MLTFTYNRWNNNNNNTIIMKEQIWFTNNDGVKIRHEYAKPSDNDTEGYIYTRTEVDDET